MEHSLVSISKRKQGYPAMATINLMRSIAQESFIERILSWFFPPKLKPMDQKGMALISEYHTRIHGRRGIEPRVDRTLSEGEHQYVTAARLIGPAKTIERKITRWELFEHRIKQQA